MLRLPFEAFLALRYLRPRRTFVSVITFISILGVTLGVAVLIIVISVMSGFDREWRDRILGFNAHSKVYQVDALGRQVPLKDYSAVVKRIGANAHVVGAAPFVRGQVLVKTQPQEGASPRVLAPLLLGIDPELEGKVSILPTNIVAGEFDVEGNGLLVGIEFARGLDLRVGDRLAIYSQSKLEQLEKAYRTDEQVAPIASEYKIHGIFDVGFSEYNSMIVVSSLENAQELYEFEEDSVHGVQVRLDDPFNAELVRKQLLPMLGPDYAIETWREENPKIFDALQVEKSMMFYLLFFIMIVAAFGIVNSQITFVVQKTREIGILKAIGATNRQVLYLFMSQSIIIGVFGVACGFGLAMLAVTYRNEFLHFMTRVTGFELLPAAIYQVYELPADIVANDIALICGTAFVTCVLAGLFPAWKASRLQPVEALRYE
ncbi:MAG: ABC transporter permease [Verrucomicrobia bacterium]|nr:ABC transporter permease [Verrucomicrobiota bacterium]